MCSTALLVVTIPEFFKECAIIVDRFESLGFSNHFTCYVAAFDDSMELEIPARWKRLSLKTRNQAWGRDVVDAINMVEEEYVLFCFDDFYPVSCTSPELLKETLERVQSEMDSSVRFIRVRDNFNRRLFPIVVSGSPMARERYVCKYDMSLVFTVTSKGFLRQVINDDDSPWRFEREGLYRYPFKSSDFGILREHRIDFVNLVVKGRVLRSSLYRLTPEVRSRYIKSTSRKIMTFREETLYHAKLAIHRAFLRWLPLIRYRVCYKSVSRS